MSGISKKERERREKSKELERRIKEFADKATKMGIADDLIFDTTFKRYIIQIGILNDLEEKIDEEDLLVTKTYVKGTENKYVNPAVGEYNKTSTAANQTAVTLVKLMQQLKADNETEDDGFDDFIKSKGY